MTDLQFATWFSRIIRWALASAFAWMAYAYKGMEFLYLFAAVIFITGFFTPKRCVDDGCEVPDKN